MSEEGTIEAAVWTIVASRAGTLQEAALEALEEGRRVSDSLAARLLVAVVTDVDDSAVALGAVSGYRPDRLVVVPTAMAPAASVASIVAAKIEEESPLLVVFSGAARCVDLGSRVSVLLHRRFADRCIQVDVENGGTIRAQRSIEGGSKHVVERWSRGPLLASMLPGAVGVGGSATGVVESVREQEVWQPLNHSGPEVMVSHSLGDPREQDLRECDVIVSVGRGVASPDGMTAVRELADALSAGIGGSRPVIEAGWLPYERQVGQTGRSVAPRVYIACGISGATQHLAGIQSAESVIAINVDSSAPILARADLAVVGDMHSIIPELTKAIVASKRSPAPAAGAAG